jgi:hypothetical protein
MTTPGSASRQYPHTPEFEGQAVDRMLLAGSCRMGGAKRYPSSTPVRQRRWALRSPHPTNCYPPIPSGSPSRSSAPNRDSRRAASPAGSNEGSHSNRWAPISFSFLCAAHRFARLRDTALIRIAGRGLWPVSDRRRGRRMALKRTAKACGSGTRGWCQIGGGFRKPNRAAKPIAMVVALMGIASLHPSYGSAGGAIDRNNRPNHPR